jgi:hypothetical protein
MSPTIAYRQAAETYADAVRVLFSPAGAPAGERGGQGPVSYDGLAAQAQELLPAARQLTRAAEAQLTDADPGARIQGATSLMAKALIDLQVSGYLLHAAMDEEDALEFNGDDAGRERSGSSPGPANEILKLVLGTTETAAPANERGTGRLRDLPAARAALSTSVEDAVDLISSRAARMGQSALSGLVGLGGAELAQAAGVVGMEIAGGLGQAEKLSQLYSLFRGFVSSSLESLVTLVGRPVLEGAVDQVLDWLGDLKEGSLFSQVLQTLYGTASTTEELHLKIANSQAALEQFQAAIQDVDRLDSAYQQQIQIAEKLLKALRFVGGVSAAALPSGALLLVGAYLALGVYVIAAGGDYVDAPRLQLLDRVPGVRVVVETRLPV